MVSVINGYVCFTSCDAAAAKQGKDPAAPPGSISSRSYDKTSGLDSRPVTVLDGTLKDLDNTATAIKTDPSGIAVAKQKVNLLI